MPKKKKMFMGSQQLVANPAYVNSKFVATGLTSSGYLWTSEISILPKTSTHFLDELASLDFTLVSEYASHSFRFEIDFKCNKL